MKYGLNRCILRNLKTQSMTNSRNRDATFERNQSQAGGRNKWSMRVPCKRLAVDHRHSHDCCASSRRGCRSTLAMNSMGMSHMHAPDAL